MRIPMEMHGQYGTPEYWCWSHMIKRCESPTDRAYRHYGGRGIKVCARWRISFSAFLADMGKRPTAKHTLDRRDNAGDYTSDNCRWATRIEQNRNRRNVQPITWNGRTQSIPAWAEELGIPTGTLTMRLLRNWTIERALTFPVSAARPKVSGDTHKYTPKRYL